MKAYVERVYTPEDKVKGRLFLDVVVAEGTAVFQLFTSKYQALLVWGDAVHA